MTESHENRALLVEDIGDGVRVLTLNRPRALNALSAEILGQLKEAFSAAGEDPSVRVILLTGSGKAFAAGADLAALAGFTKDEAVEFSRNGYELFDMIESVRQPVIAVLNGYTLGGGLELALSCDFRFAAETVQVALPEILLGIIPGFGGTQRLAAVAGHARAKDMILTGRRIEASEALEWGVLHRVFPKDTLWDESLAFAKTLAALSKKALAEAKGVLNATRNMAVAEGLERENEAFGRCFEHGDSREGIRAFLEKRKPDFEK
ncbi:MAG: enoyl-CoA hydratase/isomerase family protein [Thermovirgaceae bacterium]